MSRITQNFGAKSMTEMKEEVKGKERWGKEERKKTEMKQRMTELEMKDREYISEGDGDEDVDEKTKK